MPNSARREAPGCGADQDQRQRDAGEIQSGRPVTAGATRRSSRRGGSSSPTHRRPASPSSVKGHDRTLHTTRAAGAAVAGVAAAGAMTDAPATPPAGADAPGCDMQRAGSWPPRHLPADERPQARRHDDCRCSRSNSRARCSQLTQLVVVVVAVLVVVLVVVASESPFSSEAMTADAVVGHGTLRCSATTAGPRPSSRPP